MLRLIIICIAIYAIVKLLRRTAHRQAARREQGGTSQVVSSEMVACQACGTFILRNEAKTSGGSLFCSEACANR